MNRTTTGALVRRQPFGGFGASRFGPGVKTGGPNTVLAHSRIEDGTRPSAVGEPSARVFAFLEALAPSIDRMLLEKLRDLARADAAELLVRYAVEHDPDAIPTQRNRFRYVPARGVVIGIGADAPAEAVLREALAMVATSGSFVLARLPGGSPHPIPPLAHDFGTTLDVSLHAWPEALAAAFRDHGVARLRLLGAPHPALHEAAADADVFVEASEYVEAPRAVLRHSLDEQSLSIEVHRYGNPVV